MAVQHKDIKIGRTLGKGSFGKVYCAQYGTGHYAVKEFFTTEVTKNSFRTELDILIGLQPHDHIVSLVGYSEVPPLFLMMGLMDCSLGDTIELRRKALCSLKTNWWTEGELISYTLQIVLGLEYLHSNEVAHRDLKVMNLVLPVIYVESEYPGETDWSQHHC